jgi:hypothetical protein
MFTAIDQPKLADSKRAAARKAMGRSAITNGARWLPGIDNRSPWVRRAKDIAAAHISDLGGVDNTSAAERSIVRRASTLTVELERLETKFASAGEATPTDLDLYSRAAANLRRLLEAVGIQRRPREVGSLTATLADIAADQDAYEIAYAAADDGGADTAADETLTCDHAAQGHVP